MRSDENRGETLVPLPRAFEGREAKVNAHVAIDSGFWLRASVGPNEIPLPIITWVPFALVAGENETILLDKKKHSRCHKM